jgi:hypothetical protein
MAADDRGNVFQYDGSSWSKAKLVTGSDQTYVVSLDCLSTTYCVGVDNPGGDEEYATQAEL